jgi:hypothetical protein
MKSILTASGHDANEDLFSDRVTTGGDCGNVSIATPRLCKAAVTLKSSDSNGMMRVSFISETLGALGVCCSGVAETVIRAF